MFVSPGPVARWRSWISPLIALTIFIAVLVVIHHELAHLHLRDVLAYLRAIPPHAVLVALTCTASSYLLLTIIDAAGLRYVGRPLPYRKVALPAFLAYAVGHNLGAAPLTAGAVRYRMYASAGVSGAEVATLQGFCSVTNSIGIAVLVGLSLLVAPGHATSELHLVQPWPSIVGAALLALVAAYAAWGIFADASFELRGWTVRVPGIQSTVVQILLGTVELCVAAAVLWCLLPNDAGVPFTAFLGVYAISLAAGIVSHIPGGLGVFESVMLVGLSRVPADALLGAMVAYRALYYLLPLTLAGLAFIAREIRQQPGRLARIGALVSTHVAPIAPQIVGALVFAAGIVLLVSGATPGLTSRLAMLRRLVPLPVLETSQLVGSICGVALLILSRALFRRVREGYHLTLVALAAGIAASLLKGLDFEEAIFLTVVLGALWLGRRAFYREASVVADRFTPTWVVSIVGVLGAVIWIALFAHRHIEYSHDLWWTFVASADAPRVLRALLAAVLTAASFFALNLLRPAWPRRGLPTRAEVDRARPVIARSHESLANAALAGDKRLLFAPGAVVPQPDAFIMYQVSRRSWVALGDPVGECNRYEDLMWRFRELVDECGGWTVFYQTSAAYLALYVDLGLTPVKFGEEARVALASFSLKGGERRGLRQAHGRAQRDGAVFEVVPKDSVAPLLPALRGISDHWLMDKATGEKGFSIGAFREDYILEFPVALVRCGGVPVAFANLWATQNREELSIDLMRFGPGAPRSAMDFLFAELMLWGRAQGYRWFNLGMAPLSGLDSHPLGPAWNRIGSFVFHHFEHFYNFEGLRQYKEKFAPVWEPRYLVAPAGPLRLAGVLMDLSVLIAGGMKELVAK